MRQPRSPRVVSSDAVIGDGEVRNVSGNHFDKHGSSNPLVRRLMDDFHRSVFSALAQFDASEVLDAGCGEGRTTQMIREQGFSVTGLELERAALRQAPATDSSLRFVQGSVYGMPFDDCAFEVVISTEVLEHLDRPDKALDEMIRVASSAVIVTVPREPWWRIANVLRGSYVSRLGNTPGHIQHFNSKRFSDLLFQKAERRMVQVRATGMWRLGVIATSE